MAQTTLQIRLNAENKKRLARLKEVYRASSFNHLMRLIIEDIAEVKGVNREDMVKVGRGDETED